MAYKKVNSIVFDDEDAQEPSYVKADNVVFDEPAIEDTEDKGFFRTVGGDIAKRAGKVVDFSQRQGGVASQIAKAPATTMVAFSQGAEALRDIVSEGIIRGGSAVIPDDLKDEFKTLATKLASTDEGKWMLDKLSKAGSKVSELAKKYPDEAVALEGIANLLGASTAQKGAGLVGKGAESARKSAQQLLENPKVAKTIEMAKSKLKDVADLAPKPTEQYLQKHSVKLAKKRAKLDLNTTKQVKKTINSTLKPGVGKKRTPKQVKNYDDNALTAVTTITENKPKLLLPDENGILKNKLPESVTDMQNALDQTKKSVFEEMDRIVKETGEFEVMRPISYPIKKGERIVYDKSGKGIAVASKAPFQVDGKNIVKNLQSSIVDNKALQIEGEHAIKYAQEKIAKYKNWSGSPKDVQDLLTVINRNLEAFYKNPTQKTYSKAYVDSLVANNLRKDVNDLIEKASGELYGEQRQLYTALKTLEEDVAKAANKERNKAIGTIMPTFTDVIAGHQLISGLATLNPGSLAGGGFLAGVSAIRRRLRNPDRRIKSMFEAVDKNLKVKNRGKVAPKPAKVTEDKPLLGLNI